MPLAPFSFWTLLGLVAVGAASVTMFYVHVRRWTILREWTALRDWAGRNRFLLRRGPRATVPPPLADLATPQPVAPVLLFDRRTTLLQLHIENPAAPRPRWNVVVRDIGSNWPPTALRPVGEKESLIDLLPLGDFPALIASQRFMLRGVDPAAARSLARSVIVALLPPDVGLLLKGQRLILDFSHRPFDSVELTRMLSLIGQLAKMLPPLPRTSAQVTSP